MRELLVSSVELLAYLLTTGILATAGESDPTRN